MKNRNGSIGVMFVVLLVLFMGAFSCMDIIRGGLWAAEADLSAAQRGAEQQGAALAVAAAVGERSLEATVAVPPPEAAAPHEPTGTPTDSADGPHQNAAAPAPPKPSPEKTVSSSPAKTAPQAPNSTPAPVVAAPPASVPAPANAGKETVEPEASPADKQAPPLTAAQLHNPGGAPLIDTSHMTNETALKAIERNVSLFKDRIKERFSVWLERSARYIEIMKDVLREKNLPEELVFLPIVESGFSVDAYSSAKAVGPWQFIAGTAKRYGLVIDWWRDERKDPVKSTRAAAAYLNDLYKMFGSWNLALAAYNAGEGRIMRALKKSDADDYWSLRGTKQIKEETKEYVPRYIAATMIAHTPEHYGFEDLDYHEPLEYDEVTIQSPLDIEVIARCSECSVREVRELNPELRRWSTPPNLAQYTLRIPAGTKELFLKNLSETPKEDRFTVDTYVAKKGDTVKKIAMKTGIPVTAILAMNSFSGLERFDAGDPVKLPPRGKFVADRDDRNDQRSMVKKAVYKKQLGEPRGEKKRAVAKGKKGSSAKAKAKIASREAKVTAKKTKSPEAKGAKGGAPVKGAAKKGKVKIKKA